MASKQPHPAVVQPIAARTHQPYLGGAQTDFTAQPQDNPSTGNPPQGPRKLSHFRKAGAGDPMWSGSCVYGLTGATPSMSQYDSPDPLSDLMSDEMPYHIRNGVVTEHRLQDPKEPTTTRQARVSAHYDSSPAARFFQGFGQVHWSGLTAGFRPQIMPRPLVQNFNPNQKGSKEIHPPTAYRPFPPMGSVVGYYGEGKAL